MVVQTLFSVISSGTERSGLAGARQSLLTRARTRPDLVREVITRARRDGIRATRRAVADKLSEERPVGYSAAGRVLEVGEHVRGLAPGDLVACAGAGHASHAEVISVPANLCARVPPGVPARSAALSTIAAIALHGIRVADVRLGERVAVIGCGLVGQLTCRLLASGGAEVFGLDLDPRRCEAAQGAGADHAMLVDDATAGRVSAATRGLGVDHAIVTAAASSNAPLLLACEIARDRGSVTVVGDVPLEFPRQPLYMKELRLTVSRSYGPGRYDDEYEERGLDYPIGYVRWTEQRNMEAALDLQARGRLDLEPVIDEVLPFERAPEAYERLLGPAEERPVGAIVLSYGAEAGEETMAAQLPVVVAEPRPAAEGEPALEGTGTPPRIGLVGPGSFATRVLVPALREAGAGLAVVGGGSGPSAAAAQRLGFARVAATARDVVAAEDADAVVIATRHAAHAALCVEALEAGKHVFCEKPLALSETELGDVLSAAAASGRVLAVGFNRRFAPLFVRLRDFVRPAASSITAVYRVSAGQVPADAWVHDLSQGGGRALGEACHFVDTLTALVGRRVTSVHARGHGLPELPVQAADNLAITLGYEDGSVGTILYVAAGSGRIAKERLEAFGGERTAILDDYVRLELHAADATETATAQGQDKGHRAEIAAFVDGVRSGRLPVPLREVANVSLATLAIVESLRTGAAVCIDG